MISFEAGDIVWVDLEPIKGTEQGGRRPAIVLSDRDFNIRDQRSVICPITRNVTPWPTKVFLPEGLATRGAVLIDQIRTAHRDLRGFQFIEHAPGEVLSNVRMVLASLLGIKL